MSRATGGTVGVLADSQTSRLEPEELTDPELGLLLPRATMVFHSCWTLLLASAKISRAGFRQAAKSIATPHPPTSVPRRRWHQSDADIQPRQSIGQRGGPTATR